MEYRETPLGNTPAQHPTSPRVRPGVWGGFGIVALYFLMQFGVAIAIGTVVGLVAASMAGTRGSMAGRYAAIEAVRHNPDLRQLGMIAAVTVAAAITALIVRQTWPAQWSRADPPGFGLTRPRHRYSYALAVLLGVVMLIAGAFVTRHLAGSHLPRQDVAQMIAQAPIYLRILLAGLMVCVAPLVEELLFRGVLLGSLVPRIGASAAVVVSALVFGCAHLPDFQFAWYPLPALTLMGLVLGWLRVASHSLWPSITMHATNNLVVVAAWVLLPMP